MNLQLRKWILVAVFFFVLGASISIFYQTFANDNQIDEGKEVTEPQVIEVAGEGYPPEFNKIFETYKHIKERYIEDVPIDKMVDGAIKGMLDAIGDPYTSYMTPHAAEQFEHSIASSFQGIGAEVTIESGRVKVVSPIRGAPAEKAGVLPGDFVLTVDGESVEGLTLTEAVLKIRGPKGSTVVIEFQREGHKEPITKHIVRDTIPLETVYAEMLDDNIGKIEITQFSMKTADRFAEELNNLKKQGMQGLIVDVRNNPGGILESVAKISNVLIPNQGVVLQIEDHTGEREIIRSTMAGEGIPLVVLIDRGSASASEILAAAAQESGGYKVIGVNSVGKGSVQTTQRFADGSEIKFTIAKWLTPNGNWIDQVGITPDYEVTLPKVFTTPRIPHDTALKYDDNNNHVRSLQIMLEHLGFDPGRDDGYFSHQTEQALKDFQASQELATTGEISNDDIAALSQAVMDSLDESDTQLQKALEVIKQQVR
ncbi:S41 family peptidase [Desulfuribacillus alkaliarsenatis]|uniref:PDZ domain-containing protein n=1 Tax=Desulfuribacillus alkaliarsenatis TaxID=766136 RepID=A0A1E5G413_9FIRM|nr:S41 family peptidase [Desulfuribacillus alkaliarsenatis]OEF97827.1 hypothetical protein BHF68_13420 [Desulfuribacillus alkaliarsenatis]